MRAAEAADITRIPLSFFSARVDAPRIVQINRCSCIPQGVPGSRQPRQIPLLRTENHFPQIEGIGTSVEQVFIADRTIQKQDPVLVGINTLLFGNAPNPDPYTVQLPNFEQTKCSVRKNGIISGYAANTN